MQLKERIKDVFLKLIEMEKIFWRYLNIGILIWLITLGCSAQNDDKSTSSNLENKTIKSNSEFYIKGINLEKHDVSVWSINRDTSKITYNDLMCIATSKCDIDLFNELLNYDFDPNKFCGEYEGKLIIRSTSCDDAFYMVTKLIEEGSYINVTDTDGASLFMYSVLFNQYDLVDTLVNLGVDIYQVDRLGNNAVHSCEEPEMLLKLEELGFDMLQKNNLGQNLLHICVLDYLPEMAEFLIEKKLISPNIKDEQGKTPLDYAIIEDDRELIAILTKK